MFHSDTIFFFRYLKPHLVNLRLQNPWILRAKCTSLFITHILPSFQTKNMRFPGRTLLQVNERIKNTRSLCCDFWWSLLSSYLLLGTHLPTHFECKCAHMMHSGQQAVHGRDVTSRLNHLVPGVRLVSAPFLSWGPRRPRIPVSAAMRWWSLSPPGSLRHCMEQAFQYSPPTHIGT